MTRTRILLPAIWPVVVTALILTSCSSGTDTTAQSAEMQSEPRSSSAPTDAGGAEPPPGSTVQWGTCTNELAALASLECAVLSVPVDPANPDGDDLDLALARYRSTGSSAERIGSLVLNPGGPGGSGIEFLAGAAIAFSETLTDRFDLVSFDPRGVGDSNPVTCVDDATKDDQLSGDLTPDTPEELERAVRDQDDFLAGCTKGSGKLFAHMSTADVAADLDLVRAAIGDEKLTFLGFSYGTAIGATYATLYPENTRALVLDGAVSPGATAEERALAQARGFETTLQSFITACDADRDCALGPDSAAAIDSVRTSLDAQPLTVKTETGNRELGIDLFDLALATALYDTAMWGATAEAIADVRGDGGELLLSLVDQQMGRNPDGTYTNAVDSRTIVNCSDSTERPTVDEAAQAATRIEAAVPTFGRSLAWSLLTCIGWPEAASPRPALTGAGAPPLLVVGTLGDPATPYEWSEAMTDALESAVLLTYEGDGHTAFMSGGSCVEETVIDYLTDLSLPEPGERCPAQVDPVGFGGLQEMIVAQFVESGLPKPIAECVVKGIVDKIGANELNRLIRGTDTGRLTSLVTAEAIACATVSGD